MIAKGFLLIVIIVISAVFTVLSLVFMLIRFSSNKPGALKWLIGFILSVICLILSVIYLTRGVVNTAKNFAEQIEKIEMQQLGALDSLNKYYAPTDDLTNSEQISYLVSLEPDNAKGKVPEQFYTYLGFRDYYRLPLPYPYSLHCTDTLDQAELFNESAVEQFDINNNGERSCEIRNIKNFTFSRNELFYISETADDKLKRKIYGVFIFSEGTNKTFRNENEFRKAIETSKTSNELFSCSSYFQKF